MDIRESKGRIVSLVARLNVGGNGFQIVFVQASLIEAHREIQIALRMGAVLVNDPRIIIQHLTARRDL